MSDRPTNDDNPYTDEPRGVDTATEEAYERDSFFPYARSYWPSGMPNWAPWYERDVEDAAEDRDQMYGDDVETTRPAEESGGLEGLFGVLVVVGIVLFVFPEPATSALGAVLAVIGAVGWVLARAG